VNLPSASSKATRIRLKIMRTLTRVKTNPAHMKVASAARRAMNSPARANSARHTPTAHRASLLTAPSPGCRHLLQAGLTPVLAIMIGTFACPNLDTVRQATT
jgi:hypothetical protein